MHQRFHVLKSHWSSILIEEIFQYSRARVVVEHESRPWNAKEFLDMHSWRFGCNSGHSKEDCAVCNSLTGIGARARRARCECNICTNALIPKEEYTPVTFGDYDEIDPKKVKDLSEHQYLICGSHMFGFILKDRVYGIYQQSLESMCTKRLQTILT